MSSDRRAPGPARAAVFAALVALLAAPRVRAQDAPVPPAAPVEDAAAIADARAHFDRGVGLFEHRDFDGALAEFLRAQALSGRSTVFYNIGASYHALHRYP